MFLQADFALKSVLDINLEELRQKGVKGFIFDLDNTLMAPNTGIFTEEIKAWLDELMKEFKVAIVSNNPIPAYEKKVREVVNMPIYFKAGKPSRKYVREALKELGIEPQEAAMVGDRPLTDIWVGQRLKMVTILVDPIRKYQEHKVIKFLRSLERSFVRNVGSY
jgi:HAD superfamily phosphatase (TIGR01668 family)